MVNFKADHALFSSSMCMINTFRKDSSFCDVKLIIGKQSLHAHKCMLAAGSPYFHSLFLGQFSEASMKEINLSEVTSNITALERIVNFIYTGEVDIDEDNLRVIVKLSSFFLIESVREFCCSFMIDNVSLNTCLKFYLYSVDHGVSDIEKTTWPMVQSRFHDHLVNEEDTLDISTDEMQFLLEKNILQHCSNVSIVRFIAMWVNKGLTERHMVIAKDIFDSLIDRVNSHQICSLQHSRELTFDSLYELTESSLKDMTILRKASFLNSFKNVLLGQSMTEKDLPILVTKSQPSKETAIIAVFPSNDVIEFNKKIRNEPYDLTLTFKEMSSYGPVLYLCAYIPRTRCWYMLKKINNDGGSFAVLIERNWYHGSCRFDALHDHLLFINNGAEEIIVINFNNLENPEIDSLPSYDFLESEALNSGQSNDIYFDFCLAAGTSSSRYLVAKFRRFENHEFERVLGIYFNGYKLLNDGNTWQKLFQTQLISLPSPDEWDGGGLTNLNAKISTVSNEMIVVHSGEEMNIVFVVDLNLDKCHPLIVLSSAIDNKKEKDIGKGKGTHIVETNDTMYIVTDCTTGYNGRDNGNVMVRYEYRINSKQLTEINSTVVTVSQLQELTHNSDSYPCLSESSASVGDGLWYMEVNNNASYLTKVTIDDDKNPLIEHHTPPPFNSITAMFASRISYQILENKEPVTRYLGNE